MPEYQILNYNMNIVDFGIIFMYPVHVTNKERFLIKKKRDEMGADGVFK